TIPHDTTPAPDITTLSHGLGWSASRVGVCSVVSRCDRDRHPYRTQEWRIEGVAAVLDAEPEHPRGPGKGLEHRPERRGLAQEGRTDGCARSHIGPAEVEAVLDPDGDPAHRWVEHVARRIGEEVALHLEAGV